MTQTTQKERSGQKVSSDELAELFGVHILEARNVCGEFSGLEDVFKQDSNGIIFHFQLSSTWQRTLAMIDLLTLDYQNIGLINNVAMEILLKDHSKFLMAHLKDRTQKMVRRVYFDADSFDDKMKIYRQAVNLKSLSAEELIKEDFWDLLNTQFDSTTTKEDLLDLFEKIPQSEFLWDIRYTIIEKIQCLNPNIDDLRRIQVMIQQPENMEVSRMLLMQQYAMHNMGPSKPKKEETLLESEIDDQEMALAVS